MEANSYYNSPHSDVVTETVSRREDYGDPREETEVLIDDNGVSKTVTVRKLALSVIAVICNFIWAEVCNWAW